MRRFERELLEFMRTRNGSMLDELRTGAVPDALADAVETFKEQFLAARRQRPSRQVDPTATDADELGDARVAEDARHGVI